MDREVKRRQFVGDDGETYTVIVLEEIGSGQTMSGTSAWRGMQRMELDDDREVYRLNNRLTIRGSGVKLPEID